MYIIRDQFHPEREIYVTSVNPRFVTPIIKSMLRRKNRLMGSGRLDEAIMRSQNVYARRYNSSMLRNCHTRKSTKQPWAKVRHILGRDSSRVYDQVGIDAHKLNIAYTMLSFLQKARRVSVYLETHCNIGSKTVFPIGVLDRWHNCLLIYWRTSCLVAAFDDIPSVTYACDWVMPALSAVLLTYLVSNSVCFSCTSAARQLQRRTWWFTQYRTSDVAENVGSTFLVRGVHPRGKTLNWF